MSLATLVIERIRREGPISFHDFMEMALYHPRLGYYNSPEEKTGKNGDFITSPSVCSLFGHLLACQLEEMWRLLGEKEFHVLEYGAGNGHLCRDILDHAKNNPAFDAMLRYGIIEKSAAMRDREKKMLGERVSWHEDISGLSGMTGCVISNELVDNFPVHLVVMEDELMEVFVDYENSFTESLQPASEELKEYLRELGTILPRGYRTEINLHAVTWIRELARSLQKGFVLTIDYGYPSADMYRPERNKGTLACYYKQQVNFSPYEHIGSQDITAHVNFSALNHYGTKYGLSYGGFTNQSYFLMGLGLSAYARDREINGKPAGMTTVLLGEMGRRMKVLLQQKGKSYPVVSGMRFPLQPV